MDTRKLLRAGPGQVEHGLLLIDMGPNSCLCVCCAGTWRPEVGQQAGGGQVAELCVVLGGYIQYWWSAGFQNCQLQYCFL